jgi:hypothetical protein
VDSRNDILAVVSENSDIHMFSYSNEISPIKSKDEGHHKLTSLTCLENLKILATSGMERTVKIWDSKDNSLIRELNFGSPVYSVCFANERGDLLVGLVDQIAIVRLQDYLPDFVLKRLIAIDDIHDDEKESPASFDETVDFWSIYRQTVSRKQASALENLKDERGQTVEGKTTQILDSNDPIYERRFSISLDDVLMIDSPHDSTIFKKPFKPLPDSRHRKNLSHAIPRKVNYTNFEPEPVMEQFQAENLPSIDKPNGFPEFKKPKFIGKQLEEEFLQKLAQRRASLLRFVKVMEPVIQFEETQPQKKPQTARIRTKSSTIPNSVATSNLRHESKDKVFNLGDRQRAKSQPVKNIRARRKSSLAQIPEFLLDFDDVSSEHSEKKKKKKSKKGQAKKAKKSKKQSKEKDIGALVVSEGDNVDDENKDEMEIEKSHEENSFEVEPIEEPPQIKDDVIEHEFVSDPVPIQEKMPKKKIGKKKKIYKASQEIIRETTSDHDELSKAQEPSSKSAISLPEPESELEDVEERKKEDEVIAHDENNHKPEIPTQQNYKADLVAKFLRKETLKPPEKLEVVEQVQKKESSESSHFKSNPYKKSAGFVLKKREANPFEFKKKSNQRRSKIDENAELTDFQEIQKEYMQYETTQPGLNKTTTDSSKKRQSWCLLSRNRFDSTFKTTFGSSWFAGIPVRFSDVKIQGSFRSDD